MSKFLYRVGQTAARHPWRVIAAWLLAAVAAVALNSSVGGTTDDTFRLPGAESQHGADLLHDRFPQQSLFTSNVVVHDEQGLDGRQARAALRETVAELAQGPHVVSVTDPYDPQSAMLSADGTTAVVTVAYDQESTTPEMVAAADAAVAPLREAGIQVEYEGSLGYATAGGEEGGEMLGVLVAVVVLAVAFGSLVAMSLPIGVTLLAILIGTSALGVLSGLVPVPQIASIIGLMLGLGVGIDYALFILSRHRQNLAAGMPVPNAVGRANATAGLAVLFAGGTVVAAIAGVQISGIPMLAMMGWGAAIMVAVTMLAALTLLPALLGLAGRRINSLRVPFVGKLRRRDPLTVRWVRTVLTHPVLFGAAAAAVLVMLAIPALSMRLAFPDAGNDPKSATTRQAYDLIADAYGPGVNAPLMVVLDGNGRRLPDDLADAVTHEAARTDGVADISAPVLNPAGDLAVVTLTPTTSPQDEETSDLLAELRGRTLPALVDGTGASVYITGGTALTDDVAQQLQNRMPLFLGTVIGLSFVLLMVVFRSLLVPLKAAVLNLLSIGASYGVVVAIFQWGWAAQLIGLEDAMPIMPLAPMLMFAILFGLSMDYEVFLLSRVREQYLRHGQAKRAVLEGVGATGRVITSAAIIMIAVFASFILAPDPTTKLFGVGLAVAVLLDVTLVRMVLVPAAMSLLGDWAWWFPHRWQRWLPAVDLDGGSDAERGPGDGSDLDLRGGYSHPARPAVAVGAASTEPGTNDDLEPVGEVQR